MIHYYPMCPDVLSIFQPDEGEWMVKRIFNWGISRLVSEPLEVLAVEWRII